MADIMDVLNGISQIMGNVHDGAKDPKTGEPLKIGLKREEEVPFSDKRVIDGFKVKMYGNKLRLNYSCDVLASDVHDKKFKDDILYTIADVVSFLKKEYKKVTGNALSLTEVGEPEINMMNTSRVRSWVEASCTYEVGGIETGDKDSEQKKHFKSIDDWLAQGKKDEGDAPNDDRKE